MKIYRVTGSICLVIFDDFAKRHNLNYLTKGAGATIFWGVVLWLWILCFATLALVFDKDDVPGDISLSDSLWFSYITMTTIGLGDIALAQDDFKDADLFLVPFLSLLGFILLANFLLKLTTWINICSSGDQLGKDLECREASTKD